MEYTKTISQLQKEAHETSISKGWYEKEKSVPEHIALIHSEISEALEADRTDRPHAPNINEIMSIDEDMGFAFAFKNHVKDSFGDELADAVIRIMDLCAALEIDLQGHVEAKMRYNKTRPHKHGGKKY